MALEWERVGGQRTAHECWWEWRERNNPNHGRDKDKGIANTHKTHCKPPRDSVPVPALSEESLNSSDLVCRPQREKDLGCKHIHTQKNRWSNFWCLCIRKRAINQLIFSLLCACVCIIWSSYIVISGCIICIWLSSLFLSALNSWSKQNEDMHNNSTLWSKLFYIFHSNDHMYTFLGFSPPKHMCVELIPLIQHSEFVSEWANEREKLSLLALNQIHDLSHYSRLLFYSSNQ